MSQPVLPGVERNFGPRDPLERFYTPQAMADQLQERLLVWWREHGPEARTSPLCVVEPSVGGGAHVRAIRQACRLQLLPTPKVIGVDLDPGATGLRVCDEAHVGDWPEVADQVVDRGVDLVTGNPPFSKAREHVQAGLRVAPVVAFILPLNLLGVAKWAAIVGPDAPLHSVFVTQGRAWGANVRETAMFVWLRSYQGAAELVRLAPWAKP